MRREASRPPLSWWKFRLFFIAWYQGRSYSPRQSRSDSSDLQRFSSPITLNYPSPPHPSPTPLSAPNLKVKPDSNPRRIFQWLEKKCDIDSKSVVNIKFFEMHSFSTDFAKKKDRYSAKRRLANAIISFVGSWRTVNEWMSRVQKCCINV